MKTKQELTLIRWWNSNCPPIDFNANASDVMDLIREYIKLKQYANQSRWISADTPPDTDRSVLAVMAGKVHIMALTDLKQGGLTYRVWAKVYDGLDGDAYYDDDYEVEKWMNIPKP